MHEHDGADAIERAWRDGLKPDPLLTVSEWAGRYRVLSQRASSEPGRWRTERTPYLKEIMDCLSPASPVQRVALMKGAQIGGTECGNCWIGYVIHRAPGPMMAVSPTVEEGASYPPGACHFPQYGEDYLQQLTAEPLVTRIVKGFPRGSWEKEPGRRNGALDCRVYARAAAAICGMDRWPEARWRELERYLGRGERPSSARPEPPPEPKPSPAPRPIPRQAWLPDRRELWLGRGRHRSWWDR
jgi:phage terminase large subunit GpA-like protein